MIYKANLQRCFSFIRYLHSRQSEVAAQIRPLGGNSRGIVHIFAPLNFRRITNPRVLVQVSRTNEAKKKSREEDKWEEKEKSYHFFFFFPPPSFTRRRGARVVAGASYESGS